jgi:hypothetical protein
MARERKIEEPVVLFATIERKQHDSLRQIAFKQRKSIADIVRQALDRYVSGQEKSPFAFLNDEGTARR